MKYSSYKKLFSEILNSETPPAPYDNPDYYTYLELNNSRVERWEKKGVILTELENEISKISEVQKWLVISEPWCGDAAHIVPFIAKLAVLNPLIELEVQLRDSNSEIDKYLTNGGKSIPILVVRNDKGEDQFVWGPRPAEAQVIHLRNLTSDKSVDEKKVELQQWYNKDKGQALQHEIKALLKN